MCLVDTICLVFYPLDNLSQLFFLTEYEGLGSLPTTPQYFYLYTLVQTQINCGSLKEPMDALLRLFFSTSMAGSTTQPIEQNKLKYIFSLITWSGISIKAKINNDVTRHL